MGTVISKGWTIKPPFQPVYLFYGTQSFLIKRLRKSIADQAVDPADRDFNLSVYDLTETPIEVAIEDAMTLPFLGENRVIVLENPIFLTGDTKKTKVEHNLDVFSEYIENPSPSTILIVEAPYEKLDKRKKVVKLLESKGVVLELNQVGEKELYDLLKSEAAQFQAVYTEAAHERLMALVGFHVAQLINEVQKLSLYVGEDGEIDTAAVDLLATRSIESNVFDMVDLIMRGKGAEAIQLLEELFKQKEEPIRLLALIMRQIRILLQTILLTKEGYSQKQIASRLKLHPYAVKIANEQGRRFDIGQLKRALVWCSDTDYAMKTGQEEKQLSLQLLIHRISTIN
ncbi:DNA polymerase III subunit delta [Pullulanibacillus sp. KACC 23026]|uniref:DNA polymerase III subunit delta n=1 Tax=Pullulanibacillus sp. KACC 23026 TaxID=3028315 RepID=UPI0023AFEA7E|nr:DNA polymerase III subunit delta [Pullulanibacillus sp. KACC 23026]WEG14212.1 DNA polymerase III subunit delta [Pullulanibacillus sp. KACC 23026]